MSDLDEQLNAHRLELVAEVERLRSAIGEIASLAGSTAIEFGGSHDEQRAAIFNACNDALKGKPIVADAYRKQDVRHVTGVGTAPPARIPSPMLPTCLGPYRMDAHDGPVCSCGRPSRHQSGWCGTEC